MWAAFASLAAFASAPPPASTQTEPAHPTAYVRYSDVKGEVAAVSDQGFTLRMTWQAVGAVRQGRGVRPVAVPRQVEHEVQFADGGLVRWADVADAGPDAATPAGRARLKLPAGAPGWAADRAALKPGQAVEVVFVRPKDLPPSRVTPADLRVRYAIIRHVGPSPSKP